MPLRAFASLLAIGLAITRCSGQEDIVDDLSNDYFVFQSRPGIQAPKWDITIHNKSALAPGYWFVAPYASLKQEQHEERWVGPHIYDNSGTLIWSGVPFFDAYNCFDFRVAHGAGKEKLTVMYKREFAGVILNDHYEVEKVVDWPGERENDNMHDFTVYDDGDRALVLTQYKHTVSRERSAEVGYNGECFVKSNGLMNLDITTTPPTVLFDWNATDHLALEETTYRPTDQTIEQLCEEGWDLHHFNAVDNFPDGDFLVSSRFTDTLYKVSHINGSIIWRLGGIKSDWKFGRDALFSRQHHARVRGQNDTHIIISVFDNAKSPGGQAPTFTSSRGLVLSLSNGRAEMLHSIPHPDHHYTESRGSTQFLPNGNVFMGWTFGSVISEHSGDGTVLMEARIKARKSTYRSYKYPWTGRPLEPPDMVAIAAKGGRRTVAYVSWNGATDVKSWNLYETDQAGQKRSLLESVEKKGFETKIIHNEFIPYVYIEAIDATGTVMARSKVVYTVPTGTSQGEYVDKIDWLHNHVSDDVKTNAPLVDGKIFSPMMDETSLITRLRETIARTMNPGVAYFLGLLTCMVLGPIAFVVGRKYKGQLGKLSQGKWREVLVKKAWWKESDDVAAEYGLLDESKQDEGSEA